MKKIDTRILSGSFFLLLAIFPSATAAPASAVLPSYLKSSNPEQYGNFGSSSALSGDTLVIGAPGESDAAGNPSAGAVHVFVRSGGTWVPQARITAPGSFADDYFGSSVAISGNTMVVGAPGQDGLNPEPSLEISFGAAYVYVRSGSTWTLQATLRASNEDNYDEFGFSVAISGDDIVIGAPWAESSGDLASGAAYVFSRVNGSQWEQQANLKATDDGPYSGAGYSVAISGDTLVTDGYVFVRSGGAWNFQASLKPATAAYDDDFGAAVAISGETIVVGAPEEKDGPAEMGWRPGAVHVFQRNGAGWSHTSRITAFNADSDDNFGKSVAISGDTLVVGAENEWGSGLGLNPVSDNDANYAGAAYTFRRTNHVWTLQSYLKASNTGEYDCFGASVAIEGDTIALGAPGEAGSGRGVNPASSNAREEAGAAYLFAVSQLRQLVLAPEITVLAGKDHSIKSNATVNLGRAFVRKRSGSMILHVENTGNIPLKLAGIRKSGKHASEFTIVDYRYMSGYKRSLAPGAQLQIELRMRPKAKGIRKATLSIMSDDADEPAFKIQLKGTGMKQPLDP